ncbi:hypothetical protein A2625_03200 [candidate division WOR-1 bacterium RIFCSPHIGHO2_01_FULL_53_15]|uniref:Uncharacterized protein n=1 Tax=candidate division WOR-1 bacterium RIFCSPHIGHO2_01_FULL_53_15 TaxID=1802564 RepID=A0A1F4Q3J9_UNCSA|nr:MAG: hypothetical protein A2625_03200 [candidate division WOR-1 bacterium RIFCSPHIGHO2_01_FULL_53_15]OGC12468.1 MAG: hypothetical protein A3D23_05620 [candidate division WOR-1 bacterium RIFCSPHIGHO2_02_FULL_53_26]
MKIELILPGWKATSLWNVRAFRFAPLGLAAVAALVPEEHEVCIIDENAAPINFDDRVDLVGISAMTPMAPRAYEIASEFRKRGVKVAMGGSHASALPEEALQHVDAVLIGEAEELWPQLIEDFKNHRLRRIYKCETKPLLNNLPAPRRDLFASQAYFVKNCVQITRGCPFDCEFCSVSSFYGHTYRTRPIAEVEKEILSLKKDITFFVDDNIVGNRAYAKDFFRRIIPHKLKWISQGSITMAEDRELLELASKSGCLCMIIGFESLSQENLNSIKKNFNQAAKFKDAIKKIHAHGIGIYGIFMFGLDHDDKDVFKRTVDFIIENNINTASFTILTPMPGTRLYQKMESEGRITDRDWTKYDHLHVVFKPRTMTAEELFEGHRWAFRETYTYRSILKRILGSRVQPLLSALQNIGFRQATKTFS